MPSFVLLFCQPCPALGLVQGLPDTIGPLGGGEGVPLLPLPCFCFAPLLMPESLTQLLPSNSALRPLGDTPSLPAPLPHPVSPGTWDIGQTLQPVLCPTSCLAACLPLGALGGPGLSPPWEQSHLLQGLLGMGLRWGGKAPGLGYSVSGQLS